MTKGRVEAFSDGVIAIAITLLILDVHVPDSKDGALFDALTRLERGALCLRSEGHHS